MVAYSTGSPTIGYREMSSSNEAFNMFLDQYTTTPSTPSSLRPSSPRLPGLRTAMTELQRRYNESNHSFVLGRNPQSERDYSQRSAPTREAPPTPTKDPNGELHRQCNIHLTPLKGELSFVKILRKKHPEYPQCEQTSTQVTTGIFTTIPYKNNIFEYQFVYNRLLDSRFRNVRITSYELQ